MVMDVVIVHSPREAARSARLEQCPTCTYLSTLSVIYMYSTIYYDCISGLFTRIIFTCQVIVECSSNHCD